jgi:D-threo-aldose 1-dehydrogenase
MAISVQSPRRVGSTDLLLPSFGFGSAHLGGLYDRVSGDVAKVTLDAAWSGGVRYFDTSPFYGRGLAEHRLGSCLIDKPRDEFVLTTKVGRYCRRPSDPQSFDRAPWGGGLNMEVVWDYSYDGVMRSYEQSLLRLGLDSIDGLLLHDPEPEYHGEQHAEHMRDLADSGIRALEELKRSGQIKAIGMGLNAANSLQTIAPIMKLDFAIVAMPYTLLDQSALANGMQRCVEEDISIVIGSPYASGILATGPGPSAHYRYGIASEDIQNKVRRIQEVCAANGVNLKAAALQFPLAHPAVVSVIPGGARPEEVAENIAMASAPIPKRFWASLKAEGLIDANAPVPA